MNKMYKYLNNHNYISRNKDKDPLRQQELSKERAEAIANKYEQLVKELEEENEQLKYILNDLVFASDNNDVEFGARLLLKLGYCEFDERENEYINTHNDFIEQTDRVRGLMKSEVEDRLLTLETNRQILIDKLKDAIKLTDKMINNKKAKPYGEELHLLENSKNRFRDVLNLIKGMEE